MRSQRRAAVTCALTILLGIFSSLPAYSQKSEAEVQDDIAFAKGLAKEWGFVDLAGEVIKAIEREGVSRRTKESLGVAKCEIYAQAAIAERDRTQRNVLFEQAVASYEDFLEENPNSESAAEAESAYINTCSSFARSLELAMEEAVGEEAETLRKRRVEVLTAAVARTGTLIENLKAIKDPTEMQKRERGSVMLVRGRMLMELGRSQEEGEFSFAQAHQILEEVVFDQGEGSPNALRAYDLIGQVFVAQESWEDAAIFFQAVIDQALPVDKEQWALMIEELELAQADKEQRWLFVELSTPGLVDAMMATGEVGEACKYALHLINTQNLEGFSYSATLGYPALLAAARTLLDAGGIVGGDLSRGNGKWYTSDEEAGEDGVSRRNRQSTTDVALKIAQQVVNENQGNVLQLRGQKLIADVTTRPGAIVSPTVLYEAAEGKYNAKENEGALAAFKMVLASIATKDNSTKLLFAPKTYYYLGRAYQRLDQHLEACMAFQVACREWLQDPEYDRHNATGFYKSAEALQRNAPGDALIKALLEEAETWATKVETEDQDDILFRQAEKKRRVEKNYDAAIALYEQIQRSAVAYEKGRVNIGVCKHRQGKKDEAHVIFADYLEKYVTDDLNSLGGSANKEAKRRDAMATAGFYRALIEFERGDYQDVIDHTRDYYDTYPEQSSLAPWTMRLVGNSLTKTGKVEEAKAYLATALELYPDNKHIATFAIEFYKELKKQYAAASGDQQRAILLEMAELLAIGNKGATTLSFDNLRAESKHWFDLQNWEKAREVLEKLIGEFGAVDEHAADMSSYIRPDLAHVFLELHELQEAHAILGGLVVSLEKRPSKRTLIDYTRSVTGWLEGDAVDIRVVPGAGTTEAEFDDVSKKLAAMADGVDAKWTCEWYELKLRLAYGYYTWATAEGGPQDSRKKDSAKNQLNALVQDLGAQFKGTGDVPGVGEKCDEDPERADALGGDVLRRRLVWLWDKVN